MASVDVRDNFLRVDIYMQELSYEEIIQQPAYDTLQLLGMSSFTWYLHRFMFLHMNFKFASCVYSQTCQLRKGLLSPFEICSTSTLRKTANATT